MSKVKTPAILKQYYVCLNGFVPIDDEDYAYPFGEDELQRSIEWIKTNMDNVQDNEINIFELTYRKVKTVTVTKTTIEITD